MTKTNEETTTKVTDAPKEGTKSEKKKKSEGSKSGGSKALAGYAQVFANWEPVPVEDGSVEIDPSKLIAMFDVRSTPQPIEDFAKKCVGGINTPIKITRLKYLGPDGEQAVSPDPKGRVALKNNAEYHVIVYGRRRTRVAIKLGFKSIKAEFKGYKTWQGLVDDAWTENDARTDVTTWDKACDVKNLRDGGMLQDVIAESRQISPGQVSQYLGVFDLPEPIQKMIGNGLLKITAVRVLRALKDYDEGAVVALAQRAIDKGWTEDQLKEAAAQFSARQEAQGDNPKKGKKSKKVSRVVDFDKAEVAFLGVKKIRPLLNFAATQIKMLRAKTPEDKPEAQARYAKKLGRAEGYLEGLQQASSLTEAPAAAFVSEDEETA